MEIKKKRNNRLCRNSRHPPRDIDTKSTPPPPSISCGKSELLVLNYISKLEKGVVSNFRRLSINLKMPRSTLLSARQRLMDKSLITKECTGSYAITDLGLKAITVSTGYVEKSRGECREGRLSLHHTKFVSKIRESTGFCENYLESKNISYTKAGMKNWSYYILTLDDGRVLIKPNEVVIEIREVVGNDAETEQSKILFRGFEILEWINKELNLRVDTLTLEPQHFESMDSELAKLLYKRVGKYELNLDNGSKFWVDCSKDNMNDETDDIVLREKLDKFLGDLPDSDCVMSDVDKLKIDVTNAHRLIEGLLKISMVEKGILEPKLKNKECNFIDSGSIYYAG